MWQLLNSRYSDTLIKIKALSTEWTLSRSISTMNSLSLFDHFVVLALKTIIYLGILLEAYSEPCKTSKMELFAEMVNGFQLLEEVKKDWGQ